jgi:hypothetical protein
LFTRIPLFQISLPKISALAHPRPDAPKELTNPHNKLHPKSTKLHTPKPLTKISVKAGMVSLSMTLNYYLLLTFLKSSSKLPSLHNSSIDFLTLLHSGIATTGIREIYIPLPALIRSLWQIKTKSDFII